MKKSMRIPACLLMLVLFCTPAFGQEESSGGDEWEFVIIPYLWGAGLDGDVTVKGVTTEVDAGFDDILDVLDFAGQVHFEAQKGRWGLFLDTTYMKLSADEDVSSARGIIGADIDVSVENWLVEFGGFYRVAERRVGSDGTRSLVFDVLAGGRYIYLKSEIEIQGTGPLGVDIAVDGTQDWVDPIVGARVYVYLTDRFLAGVRGDIGGFDVGDSSDFAWNILAVLGYELSPSMTVWAGYRILDVDYDDGSGNDLFEYDVTMSGPIVGLAVKF